MQYETLMNFDLTAGTCLQGYVSATYEELVAAFGTPLFGNGHTTQVEWVILLTDEDETRYIATIYDWKCGDGYVGEGNGMPPEAITTWYIGGRKREVVRLIDRIMVETKEMIQYEQDNQMYQWDYDWQQSDQGSIN